MDKNLILQLLHQLTDIHTSGYLSNSSKSSLTPLTSTQLPDIHASGYFMMSIDPVGHSYLSNSPLTPLTPTHSWPTSTPRATP